MTCANSCVELGKLAVPGMRIKVRWFPGGGRKQELWRAPANILTYSLVLGEQVLLRNMSKDCPGYRPAAPLMFWPRAAVWESLTEGSQILTVSSYFDGDFTPPDGEAGPQGIAVDDFAMLEMMRLLHDEVRTPGDASDELVRAIGSVLRIRLSRLTRQSASRRSPTAGSRNIDITMIHNAINSNGGCVPTIKELAALCNTNRRSLLRLVKGATGKTVSGYIGETKLNRAKMLLATSSMTLKQIAHEAGYSTASNFSSKFKSLTGMTPSAFRKQARRHL